MSGSDTIQWNETMMTGVAEMDRQHRILVETLNEAKTKLRDKAHDPRFDQITRDLLAYAIYHFDTEEQLMRQHGYADAAPELHARHLAEHRQFSERVVALRAEADDGMRDARSALVEFLTNWLVNHLLTTDRQLAQFILTGSTEPVKE